MCFSFSCFRLFGFLTFKYFEFYVGWRSWTLLHLARAKFYPSYMSNNWKSRSDTLHMRITLPYPIFFSYLHCSRRAAASCIETMAKIRAWQYGSPYGPYGTFSQKGSMVPTATQPDRHLKYKAMLFWYPALFFTLFFVTKITDLWPMPIVQDLVWGHALCQVVSRHINFCHSSHSMIFEDSSRCWGWCINLHTSLSVLRSLVYKM